MYQGLHPGCHFGGRQMSVGEPDERHQQRLVGRQCIVEPLFTLTVSLAHLTLHAITVDSVMEPFLRHADQHLYRFVTFLTLTEIVDDSQREGCQRFARRLPEEHVNQSLADEALPFLECGANTFHLIIY